MTFFRKPLSACIAWAMIPMAAWAGMPSTGCVCANGHLKFFCQQLKPGAPTESHESGCKSACCSHEIASDEADSDHDADCCGGGSCCHGPKSGKAGVGSKACCTPILTSPSVAPEGVSVPCDQAVAVVAIVPEIGALVHPSFTLDVAEFDTGPPLDRVIVFRSLLI